MGDKIDRLLHVYDLSQIDISTLDNEDIKELLVAVRENYLAASLGEDYRAIYELDLVQDSFFVRRFQKKMRTEVAVFAIKAPTLTDALMGYVDRFVLDRQKEEVRQQIRAKAILERLSREKEFTIRYRVKPNPEGEEYFEMHFVDISAPSQRGHAALGIRCVDDVAHREIAQQRKVQEALMDGLTTAFNRRSFESEIVVLGKQEKTLPIAVVAADVNDLKNVNDEYGHAAGDELIMAAAQLMQEVFGEYGKCFRTGGDEFTVLLSGDYPELENLMRQLRRKVDAWSGMTVKCLAVSFGYAQSRENPQDPLTIRDMIRIADQRMYEDKEAFYRAHGMDRRSQLSIYEALRRSYIQIIRANLTTDTFELVQPQETVPERKGKKSLSEAMHNYVVRDFICKEDQQTYMEEMSPEHLKTYFDGGGRCHTLVISVNCKGSVHRIMIEIIPEKKYTPQDQKVFIYVKDIDREE